MDKDSYIITYSNHFEFNGELFSFRKKMLFNLSGVVPKLVKIQVKNNGSKGIEVRKKWLSWSEMEKLAKDSKPINIDISDSQWYIQEQLNHCFNLW